MNISGVRSILAGINDIKVIGRSAVLDGVVSNVMGLARHGGEMRLLILQYDECFHEKAIEAEWQELNASSGKPENNRALLRNDRFLDARDPFPSVLKSIHWRKRVCGIQNGTPTAGCERPGKHTYNSKIP